MEREWGTRTGEVLAGVLGLLDGLDDGTALATDAARVGMAEAAIEAADRLRVLASVLVAECEALGSDVVATGLRMVSWLADVRRMTRREGSALLAEGRALARFPRLRAAALAGEVSPQQARAITKVLADLPDDLATATLQEAEEAMLGFAGEFDSHGLSKLAAHLLEVLVPEHADQLEAARLEREEKKARRNRELNFYDNGDGSVQVRGKLPRLAAQTLMAQIEAIAQADRRRAIDRLDPLAEDVTPAMRRADALLSLAEAAARHQVAPNHGGDRPRIVVKMPLAGLQDLAARAGLVATGDPVGAGDLRRLCCDAELVPVVLGGASEVLDVGRAHRLVTAPIRVALNERDGGCTFPGCDKPPVACEAHHIVPWQDGGPTSLENLTLLCPQHHGIVEPTAGDQDRRWQIRLGDDGIAEVLPPAHVDATRRPRRHQRFRFAQAA